MYRFVAILKILNWPLDDKGLHKIHKLYRLVAYQRCSRWVIQIWGNKNRTPLPACVYIIIDNSHFILIIFVSSPAPDVTNLFSHKLASKFFQDGGRLSKVL